MRLRFYNPKIKLTDQQIARDLLLSVDETLWMIGGEADIAVGRLYPHRAAIPGTVIDDACDPLRRCTALVANARRDLLAVRRLVKKGIKASPKKGKK